MNSQVVGVNMINKTTKERERKRESGIPHLMLEWKLVEKIHEIKHNSDSRGHKLTKMYTYTT